MVENIFPFGNQAYLPISVLIFIRKFSISLLFSYSSFRIWYGFTVDKTYSLELVSFL